MSIIGAARMLFTVEGVQDVRRGNAEVQQSLEQTGRVASSTFEKMSAGQLRVVNAQRRYQDAIRRSGAESNGALRALQSLRLAEERLATSSVQAAHGAERSGTAFRGFAHDVERAGFGVAVGSKAIHGLRSALFFSASGLAGFGLTSVIRASRDAAVEQQVTLGQLQAALKAAGLQQSAYTGIVKEGIEAQEKLGFSQDDSARSLSLAVRATKNVEGAQRLQAIAADVARGRNMSLIAATQLLVRVQAGQVGSLRRLGIEVAKGVTGTQALEQVQRQYAGAAVAYSNSAAGAQDRFNIALHHTEETVGTALLPVITNLNTKLAKWLENSKNQKRIQDDVNGAVRVGGELAHTLATGFRAVSAVVGPLNRILGGTENTIRDIGVVLLGLKLRSLAADMGLFGLKTKQAGANAAVAAGEYNTLAAAEQRAATSGTGTGIPLTDLRSVGRVGLPTGIGALPLSFFGSVPDIIKTLHYTIDGQHEGAWLGKPPKPGSTVTIGGVSYVASYRNGKLDLLSADALQALAGNANTTGTGELNPRAGVPGSPAYNPRGGGRRRGRRPLSLQAQFNLAAYRLAQAGGTATTTDDERALNDELSIVNRQIAAEKNLAAKTQLIDQRNGIVQQLQQIIDDRQRVTDEKIRKAQEGRHKRLEARLKKKRAAEKALNDRIKRLYQEDIAGSTSNANTALKDRSEYLNKKYGLGGSTAAKTAAQAAGLSRADIRAEERSAISTLNDIIRNESNVSGGTGDGVTVLKQIRTHLLQSENHLRIIRQSQAMVTADQSFRPAAIAHYAQQAAFA